MLIENAPGQDVAVGDRWKWAGDVFLVQSFQIIATPWGNCPRAILSNVASGEQSLQDPTKMTVAGGWKLVARQGRIFQ